MLRTRTFSSVMLVLLFAAPQPCHADCPPCWQALRGGVQHAEAAASCRALAVFDDGIEPAIYVGGYFDAAGGVPASNIAKWDGQHWADVGGGVGGVVGALCVHNDGKGTALYASGWFTTAGGNEAAYIAKWDGQNWFPLGSGLDAPALCMATFDDGSSRPQLYVGGGFKIAGGLSVTGLAKWDGEQWSRPPGALENVFGVDPTVGALEVVDDGKTLIVGGTFRKIDGELFNNVAAFNGLFWSSLGDGLEGALGGSQWVPFVMDLLRPALEEWPTLMACGAWQPDEATGYLATWDGTAWSGLGGGFGPAGWPTFVGSAIMHDDGSGMALYAGGHFELAGGSAAVNVARYNGQVWSPVGPGLGPNSYYQVGVREFAVFRGQLHACGVFSAAGDLDVNGIARWAPLSGDLDCDGLVGQPDLGIVLAAYGCTKSPCPGDLDGDGDTDQADLGIILAAYGQRCPQ